GPLVRAATWARTSSCPSALGLWAPIAATETASPSRPRFLLQADRSVSSPSDRSEPRARGGHGRWRRLRGHRTSPTTEPEGGRTGIKTTETWHVFPRVLQDIDESVSHLTRCPEPPGMISVAPETSGPVEGAVDSLREPDGEPLEPPRERFSTLRFDDQVNVIGLD